MTDRTKTTRYADDPGIPKMPPPSLNSDDTLFPSAPFIRYKQKRGKGKVKLTRGTPQSLKEVAQDKLDKGNASQLGDPVSLKAETADSHPTDQDRGAADVDEDKLHRADSSGKVKSKL